ncbi:MAG TPA: hypothetical protein VK524_19760 [Polyangiaceae bacterium]|nr:hypothetical protein [Polyangiaceae bacterium]
MATKRQREREQSFLAQRRDAWPSFRDAVNAINTREDLRRFLHEQMPKPDTPARLYFTSLMFFIDASRRPGQASESEWALYKSLAERLVANGEWPASALDAFNGQTSGR